MDEQQRPKRGSGEHPAVQNLQQLLGEYTQKQTQALRDTRKRANERMQEVKPEALPVEEREAT